MYVCMSVGKLPRLSFSAQFLLYTVDVGIDNVNEEGGVTYSLFIVCMYVYVCVYECVSTFVCVCMYYMMCINIAYISSR